MAIRTIRTMGDETLTRVCKPVKEMNERTRELIGDMFDTMYDANGVGLAAPQVGIRKRIVVIDVDDGNQYVLVNPEITSMEGNQTGYEGCLSVPGKSGVVSRPEKVHFRALDINMKPYEMDAEGLLARAVCHECDHLDGHLYVELVEGELVDNDQLEASEEDEEDGEEGFLNPEDLMKTEEIRENAEEKKEE